MSDNNGLPDVSKFKSWNIHEPIPDENTSVVLNKITANDIIKSLQTQLPFTVIVWSTPKSFVLSEEEHGNFSHYLQIGDNGETYYVQKVVIQKEMISLRTSDISQMSKLGTPEETWTARLFDYEKGVFCNIEKGKRYNGSPIISW